MKTHFSKYLLASLMLAGTASLFAACSETIAHEESTKKDWFGNTKHVEDTTYRNPDGSISRTREEVKINP